MDFYHQSKDPGELKRLPGSKTAISGPGCPKIDHLCSSLGYFTVCQSYTLLKQSAIWYEVSVCFTVWAYVLEMAQTCRSILGHLGPEMAVFDPGSLFSSPGPFDWWVEVHTCQKVDWWVVHPCQKVDFWPFWPFLALFPPYRLYRKIPQIWAQMVNFEASRAGNCRFWARDPFQLARTFRLMGRSPFLSKSRFLAILVFLSFFAQL